MACTRVPAAPSACRSHSCPSSPFPPSSEPPPSVSLPGILFFPSSPGALVGSLTPSSSRKPSWLPRVHLRQGGLVPLPCPPLWHLGSCLQSSTSISCWNFVSWSPWARRARLCSIHLWVPGPSPGLVRSGNEERASESRGRPGGAGFRNLAEAGVSQPVRGARLACPRTGPSSS